jgi:inner membrane protein
MQRALHVKTLTIAALALALFIPVSMIRDLITERQARRNEAIQGIAMGWGQRQVLAGPYLVVPYQRTWTEVTRDVVDGVVKERRVERSESLRLRIPPDEVRWSVDLASQEKSRGIYTARLYAARIMAEGRITLPAQLSDPDGRSRYRWDAPQFVVGISDPRGVRQVAALRLGDEDIEFTPGTGDAAFATGIHGMLPQRPAAAPRTLAFTVAFELAGSETIALAPLAHDTQVTLRSDWPHPSFQGVFLPLRSETTPQGFSAHWRVSRYAAQGTERLAACAKTPCPSLTAQALEVSLIEPAGLYQQLDRASKYGFLFIGLSFIAVFLLELLRRLAIHPVQYALIGMALAIFFLLLTALSEHVAFGAAYALATLACVGIITAYVMRVLKSPALGLAFGGALGALYAGLYLLLRAEDHALLGGALLLFALLAAGMLATRNTDWYELSRLGAARE